MARSLRQHRIHVARLVALNMAPVSEGGAASVAQQVAAFIDVDDEKPKLFRIKVCREGVTALRFNLKNALVAAVAVVGGVAGANPVSAAAAVICCLFALHDAIKPVPDVLARIVLYLYEDGQVRSIGDIAQALLSSGYAKDDVRERVMDLQLLDAVVVQNDMVHLRESVAVPYRELGAYLP